MDSVYVSVTGEGVISSQSLKRGLEMTGKRLIDLRSVRVLSAKCCCCIGGGGGVRDYERVFFLLFFNGSFTQKAIVGVKLQG